MKRQLIVLVLSPDHPDNGVALADPAAFATSRKRVLDRAATEQLAAKHLFPVTTSAWTTDVDLERVAETWGAAAAGELAAAVLSTPPGSALFWTVAETTVRGQG